MLECKNLIIKSRPSGTENIFKKLKTCYFDYLFSRLNVVRLTKLSPWRPKQFKLPVYLSRQSIQVTGEKIVAGKLERKTLIVTWKRSEKKLEIEYL